MSFNLASLGIEAVSLLASFLLHILFFLKKNIGISLKCRAIHAKVFGIVPRLWAFLFYPTRRVVL